MKDRLSFVTKFGDVRRYRYEWLTTVNHRVKKFFSPTRKTTETEETVSRDSSLLTIQYETTTLVITRNTNRRLRENIGVTAHNVTSSN